ncbi:MAG: serine--tRNA ligase [Edaphobacter sp.]
MIDLAFVRANLPLVEEKLRARGVDPATALGDFATIDRERREAITQLETLKAQRNKLTEEIAKLRREGSDATAQTEQTRTLKSEVESLEAVAMTADERLREIMQTLPNLPQDTVPIGKDEHGNREEKKWGTPPTFPFPAKPHWELGEALGILDFNRAAKISGSRFVVHFGQGARLERALANFMLDLHTRSPENQGHGYTEVLPPYMVNSKSLFGTGQLPKFAEDLFHCDDKGAYQPGAYQDGDHWLIPTAEVPVTNLFRDEILDEAELPISYCAYTPCFRSEAGSYGKDVRGMIRQHQFQKVELVKFAKPEDSNAEHERLTRHAETVLEKLGLPYRRMLLCTGDMGFSSAKT